MNENLKHKKQSGFKIPDGYFDTLEEAVFNKMKAQSQLKNIKSPGFNVPKDYFKTVEDNVLKTLNNTEKEVKVVSLLTKRNLLYLSGVAAAIVLMFSIFNSNNTLSFDSIETEMVESYISTHDINSEDLASLWSETDLNDVAFTEYEFLDETVEDYILDDVSVEDLLKN